MQPCPHDSRELYEKLIGPLRERARELGYALCVHGSLVRDIDLVAVPWVEEAVDARTLAYALRDVAALHNDERGHKADLAYKEEAKAWWEAGKPGYKPHGRLCWMFHLGLGPYLDLSVLPRDPADSGSEVV